MALLALTGGALSGCTSGPGAERHEPRLTTIDTEPPGASVYIEGGFVGISPASFHLPAMPEVVIRLERQGSSPVEETLRRNPGYPKDAPEGVGWDERYFWQLNSR